MTVLAEKPRRDDRHVAVILFGTSALYTYEVTLSPEDVRLVLADVNHADSIIARSSASEPAPTSESARSA